MTLQAASSEEVSTTEPVDPLALRGSPGSEESEGRGEWDFLGVFRVKLVDSRLPYRLIDRTALSFFLWGLGNLGDAEPPDAVLPSLSISRGDFILTVLHSFRSSIPPVKLSSGKEIT